MDILQQLQVIKNIENSILKKVYSWELRMKLSLVYRENKDWYDKNISLIERLNSIIEFSIMNANAKRACHYCIVLNDVILRLEEEINNNYTKNIEKNIYS